MPTLKSPLRKGLITAQRTRKGFYWVFAVVFTLLFVGVVFANPHYLHYQPAIVMGLALLWGALFYGLYRLCHHFGAALQKWEKLALPLFFVLVLATQVLFYWQLDAWPSRDFERVYTGAVNFTVNGFIEEPYLDYFYKYPNNMPLTILLQFAFRAFHRVGFSDFRLIGVVISAGCAWLNYLFVYLSVRRLMGVGRAFFAVGLLWLCLPLQAFISIFYTDMVTLPFITAAFYLYLRLVDAKSWKGRLLAGGVAGLVLGLGTKIKYSVVLVLIAIAIDLLLRKGWRALLCLAGAFLVFFLLISTVIDGYMYGHFLDKTLAKDRATPFSAWIMMGLKGDGGHNPEDNYIIWDEPTAEAKSAKAAEVIKARLEQHTPASFVAFLYQKALHSFGSGNLDYNNTVADSPVRQTFLVECVSENGRHFAVFDHITQGWHVALFALMIAGAVWQARKGGLVAFVPYLAVFGLLLFLLLWESGPRYLLNHMGLFILAATLGEGFAPLDRLAARWRGRKSGQRRPSLPEGNGPPTQEAASSACAGR